MAQPLTSHLDVACPHCGAQMSIHQRYLPGHCGAAACQRAHAVVAGEKQRAARIALYKRRTRIAQDFARDEVAALSAQHGIAVARIHVAPVPHGAAPLVPLPQARKDAYLAHLDRILAEGFDLPPLQRPPSGRDLAAQAREPHPWNTTACATCQGRCCAQGGGTTYAFQTAETIQHLRNTDPDLSPEAIRSSYAEALPEHSTEDSCVFQGERGCTLARHMRADICNTFRCSGLRQLAEGIDLAASDAVMLVSVVDDDAKRTGFFVIDDKAVQTPDGEP